MLHCCIIHGTCFCLLRILNQAHQKRSGYNDLSIFCTHRRPIPGRLKHGKSETKAEYVRRKVFGPCYTFESLSTAGSRELKLSDRINRSTNVDWDMINNFDVMKTTSACVSSEYIAASLSHLANIPIHRCKSILCICTPLVHSHNWTSWGKHKNDSFETESSSVYKPKISCAFSLYFLSGCLLYLL